MTLDHVESSELLGPLVSGRLDPARRADLERHLATCDECSDELRAIRALVALQTVELTPDERTRLRMAITPGTRRPTWARFMPALAAAAVVALGVVAYSTLDVGGADMADVSQEAEGADQTAEGVRDGRDAGQAASLEAGAGGAERSDTDAYDDTTNASGAGGTTADMAVEGAPLKVQAKRAGGFAHAALQPALLDHSRRRLNSVARTLPTSWSAQLEACTRRLYASQPMTLTLAYAQAFPRDDLLVAGFVWSESTSGTPTNFAFWGWWRGDCDTASPVHVRGTL